MNRGEAEEFLLRATGRRTVTDALSWAAEGHPLSEELPLQRVMRAITVLIDDAEEGTEALRRVARLAAASKFDSSSSIFRPEIIEPLSTYRQVLDLLAWKSPSKTLDGISESVVAAAQRENPRTMEVLCAVVGLSFREFSERLPSIPSNPNGPWSSSAVRSAFEELVRVMNAEANSVPNALPAQPVEFVLGATPSTWTSVEQMRKVGVPYEVLLAQRTVGSAWGAHRNRTSGEVGQRLVDQTCEVLTDKGISFERASSAGGTATKDSIRDAAGGAGQISLLVMNSGSRPAYGVAFSTASNGATARKNVGRLVIAATEAIVPLAVVVTGTGWADRNETADLARALSGRLFGDGSLAELVADIEGTLRSGGDE